MYDPKLGQFTSEDPIGFDADDANLRRYVGNSPTNATDPTGLDVYDDLSELPEGSVFMDQYLWYKAELDNGALSYKCQDAIQAFEKIVEAVGAENVFVHYVTKPSRPRPGINAVHSPTIEAFHHGTIAALDNMRNHTFIEEGVNPLIMRHNIIFSHSMVGDPDEIEDVKDGMRVLRRVADAFPHKQLFDLSEVPVKYAFFCCGAPVLRETLLAEHQLSYNCPVESDFGDTILNTTIHSLMYGHFDMGSQRYIAELDDLGAGGKLEVHFYFGEVYDGSDGQGMPLNNASDVLEKRSDYADYYGLKPFLDSLIQEIEASGGPRLPEVPIN